MTDADTRFDDCWNRIGTWRKGEEVCPRLKDVLHCHNCDVYSRAGRQMLRRPLTAEDRKAFTQIYSEPPRQQKHYNRSITIFRLGDEWLGINSHAVDEITSARPIQRLPHTRHTLVKGLVNMRGELQICISLGGILGLEPGSHEPRVGMVGIGDRMIQIQREGDRYVFPVTEVHGLHHFHDSELHNAPATVSKAKSTYTRGVLKWNDVHVACLDEELIFHTLGKGLR